MPCGGLACGAGRIHTGLEFSWFPGLAVSVVGGLAAGAAIAFAEGFE
jgi:hypothetical protein